jgi:hypothetical protein
MVNPRGKEGYNGLDVTVTNTGRRISRRASITITLKTTGS